MGSGDDARVGDAHLQQQFQHDALEVEKVQWSFLARPRASGPPARHGNRQLATLEGQFIQGAGMSSCPTRRKRPVPRQGADYRAAPQGCLLSKVGRRYSRSGVNGLTTCIV